MKIGLLQVKIYIPESHSFKEKRGKMAKLKWGLKREFNVSVCELKNRDKWQSQVLGILLLGRKASYVSKVLYQIIKYIEKFADLRIIDYDIQLI